MPRNQWSRRKSSTKPEDGEAPADERKGSSPRKIALDILARREHSVAELREKLQSREFQPEEIEQTLSALTEDGLLSEPRFIDSFLASYTRRGHGPLWLRAELERRGIDGAQASAALAGHAVDWASQVRAVRAKRFGAESPADYKERARQSRFLQYRGFSAEQVRAAFSGDDED
jgi:regulatory protein